jgi:hypothetical protein
MHWAGDEDVGGLAKVELNERKRHTAHIGRFVLIFYSKIDFSLKRQYLRSYEIHM